MNKIIKVNECLNEKWINTRMNNEETNLLNHKLFVLMNECIKKLIILFHTKTKIRKIKRSVEDPIKGHKN